MKWIRRYIRNEGEDEYKVLHYTTYKNGRRRCGRRNNKIMISLNIYLFLFFS